MAIGRLGNSVHDKKVKIAKSSFMQACNSLGVDSSIILDEEKDNVTGIFPRIFSDFSKTSGDDLRSDTIIPNYLDERFYREIRFWRSENSDNYGTHWMQPKCTTRSKYFPMFMEEVYGREDVLTSYFDKHNVPANSEHPNDRVLALVTNHNVILEISGIASIVYTGFSSDNPLKLDGRDFTRHLLSTHPYCNSSTLHELFKILLEWQWAYNDLGSREPIAQVADSFLRALGMNVSDVDINPVVAALMELPDQQLAQFIKTGECNLSENDPGCPQEFFDWCKKLMEVLNLALDYRKLLKRNLI